MSPYTSVQPWSRENTYVPHLDLDRVSFSAALSYSFRLVVKAPILSLHQQVRIVSFPHLRACCEVRHLINDHELLSASVVWWENIHTCACVEHPQYHASVVTSVTVVTGYRWILEKASLISGYLIAKFSHYKIFVLFTGQPQPQEPSSLFSHPGLDATVLVQQHNVSWSQSMALT